MIDRGHDLPITKQAEVLRISRGSIYYLPRPVPEADLAIMRRLDRLHLEFPFAGSRMLRGLLVAEGCKIGRRHVKTLMQRMGIEALYRRPRTTKPEAGHKIYPYLLRGLAITRPNHCPRRVRLGLFRSCKRFPCTILATEGEHMATSAKLMRALRKRERERRGLRVIAAHGYEGAASADHDLRAQAVSLFIHRHARLARSARVTALRRATPFQQRCYGY